MNKVKLNVVKQVKVDGRNNNTGRPVNKKSARQLRLKKQSYYKSQYTKFMNGNTFTILNTSNTYTYECSDDRDYGYISSAVGGHVCNVKYIGRTKVTGFTYVLNKCVNVEINIKEVTFLK